MTGIAAQIVERVAAASAGEIALAVVLSAGTVLVSIGVTALLLVRLPADYFVAERRPLPLAGRSTALRVAAAVAKILGALLSLPGVPGQGILTILLGIMLMDIPGKRRLEGAIVRRRMVHRAINRLRSRFQKPPIVLPQIRRAESC